jgi:hypothetical protein
LTGYANLGVLNKDPSVYLDGARPHPKYVCKYTKIRKKILHNTPNFLGEASVQKGLYLQIFIVR